MSERCRRHDRHRGAHLHAAPTRIEGLLTCNHARHSGGRIAPAVAGVALRLKLRCKVAQGPLVAVPGAVAAVREPRPGRGQRQAQVGADKSPLPAGLR